MNVVLSTSLAWATRSFFLQRTDWGIGRTALHRNRGVVPHNARRKAEESSASGTMDGGTVCEEEETKHQIPRCNFTGATWETSETDFADSILNLSVGLSIEDKRAIAMMEGLLKMVNGAVVPSSITAVTTPPPLTCQITSHGDKASSTSGEASSRKGRLVFKVQSNHKYIEEGHTERVPTNKLALKERPMCTYPTIQWHTPLILNRLELCSIAPLSLHTSLN